jgi:monoamine oxidase
MANLLKRASAGEGCFTSSSVFRKIYFPERSRYLLAYCDGDSALKLHGLMQQDERVAECISEALVEALPFAALPRVKNPMRSGWQFWGRGVSFWDRGLKLFPDDSWSLSRQIYYCSDLCTPYVGWIEGAIVSGQDAAARVVSEMTPTLGGTVCRDALIA